MNRSGRLLLIVAVAAATSLLLARTHPFGNAHLYDAAPASAPILDAGDQAVAAPPQARAILTAKCADCHSMQVHVPFYGRLAPASWLLEHHVIEGRRAMNLSAWTTYTPEQQRTLKAKMVAQMKSGEMPPWEYTLIHRNARVTAADIAAVTDWARQSVSAQPAHASLPLRDGDPGRGKLLFAAQCSGCHAMRRNHEGPKLEGIYGHPAAAVPGFAYSAALRKSRLAWDDATLDRWLADPDALVPDNNMEFPVTDAKQRRDLICYLRASSERSSR